MRLFRSLKSWHITQSFGVNKYRFAYGATGHPGTDCRASFQSTILAAQDGIVTEVKNATPYDAYGRYVVIDHGSYTETLYAHLDVISVKVGQYVVAGQTIGLSGGDWRKYDTQMRRWRFGYQYTPAGYSTAPHLHFGVKLNGKWANPSHFLLSNHATMIEKQDWHKATEKYCLDKGYFDSSESTEQFVSAFGGNDKAHRLMAFTVKVRGDAEALDNYIKAYTATPPNH